MKLRVFRVIPFDLLRKQAWLMPLSVKQDEHDSTEESKKDTEDDRENEECRDRSKRPLDHKATH
jgi:hypothetical protein